MTNNLIPWNRAQPSKDELEAWDRQHIWHPFTPHDVYAADVPLMVVAGEGHTLIDIDGKRHIDAVGSLWCNLFGHRRAEIDRAVVEQLQRIAHSTLLGHTHPLASALAHRLADIAPSGLTRVFFSDDGSTAVESALKIAFQYWQQEDGGSQATRKKFVTFDLSYHGDTIGAVSSGNIDLFQQRYGDLLFDTIKAPAPYVYRSQFGTTAAEVSSGCLESLRRIVDEHRDNIAAVLIEPGFQGAAGIIVQPEGFLRGVADIARQAGALLICDEVAVGLGRSGSLFACEREGIAPDLLCIAKGLTGGYLPLAATLAKETVFDAFRGPPHEGRTFFHGHTYSGNQLGAAAALASLDILTDAETLSRVGAAISHLAAALSRLETLPAVGDIRQYGLAAGIELVADRATRRAFPAEERRGARVCTAARKRGVLLRPLGDVVVLMPPLTITDGEIDAIVDALAASVEEICS